MAKLTISISESARRRIDEQAEKLEVTRSEYVERLVQQDAREELTRLLEEGYRQTAPENEEFARGAAALTWEVVKRAS